MNREERYRQVKRLRDEGLLLREIAERLGIAKSTVHDVLVDPSGEKVRARKARYRTPCVDCGTLTNPGGLVRHERCIPCAGAHSRAMTRRWILDSFVEWADLHGGVPPTAKDWVPALARQAGEKWRVDRMRATGRPWPSCSAVQDHFGSWNEGVRAAGFEPRSQGSKHAGDCPGCGAPQGYPPAGPCLDHGTVKASAG